MRIIGYSERGIVSSLLYELAFSKHSVTMLSSLLRLISFPLSEFEVFDLNDAQIFVEQSFSDFGDLDVLLLLDMGGVRQSIFIEAKVKPSQSSKWSIRHEWQKFLEGIDSQLSSSNLFTQLYHKARLVEGLRLGGIDALQAGLEFPSCSTKSLRKIGSNEVVLRAARLIRKYSDNVYYVCIIPEDYTTVQNFFSDVLAPSSLTDLSGWDVRHYGFLTWGQVEAFCIDNQFKNTLAVFEHNQGQIF